MVRRCAWGTCNMDARYPERMRGARFITFPNPKTKREKCLRWIRACGRPHEQLNVDRINLNKVVCSTGDSCPLETCTKTLHFMGGDGPSDSYPDPIPADGSFMTPTRPLPKRRRLEIDFQSDVLLNKENNIGTTDDSGLGVTSSEQQVREASCQTDAALQDSFAQQLVMMKIHNKVLKEQLAAKDKKIKELEASLNNFQSMFEQQQPFSANGIRNREKSLKNLFSYYTGITYVNFLFLFTFLFPNPNEKIEYKRKNLKCFSNENALLLFLCRLRHDFGLKDLAMRFGLSLQSTGIVFNTILDLMYFKFGQISIWPHRDEIISRMPSAFKKDFPNTLIIIDGTEFKTQVPNALGLQSQMYSDYKSSTTFKALIGCDPSGSIIFISELFTGSISDKMICEESGFYALLQELLKHGYVKQGDAVMADKGFLIKEELAKLGLSLNIPPLSSSTAQMPPSDTYLTQKIAKHRVHVERVIAKVKTYKLISHRIPASLFKQANKIWTVCAILTLHQNIFVKDK